jgi:hypothetical protein
MAAVLIGPTTKINNNNNNNSNNTREEHPCPQRDSN